MKKKIKTIGIWGYYGSSNLGDDILLSNIICEVKRVYPEAIINVTVRNSCYINAEIKNQINCIEPPKGMRQKSIRIYRSIAYRVKFVKNNELIIFGGGTSLFETGKITFQPFLIKFIALFLNSIFFKHKVVHLGVGIGHINTSFSKWLFKNILNLSDVIMLRDRKSYEIVKSTIGNKSKIVEGYDLSFLGKNHIYEKKNSKTFKVGVSFFQYYGYISNNISKAKIFEQDVVNLVKYLLKNSNVEVYLFSFQKNTGGNDQTFNEKILAKIHNQHLKHIKYENNSDQFLSMLGNMNLCIGMRYHFCLLSLQYKIKTLGINYQPKVKNEFDGLGLGNFCVEIDEINQIPKLIESNNLMDKNNISNYKKVFEILDNRHKKVVDITEKILINL